MDLKTIRQHSVTSLTNSPTLDLGDSRLAFMQGEEHENFLPLALFFFILDTFSTHHNFR